MRFELRILHSPLPVQHNETCQNRHIKIFPEVEMAGRSGEGFSCRACTSCRASFLAFAATNDAIVRASATSLLRASASTVASCPCFISTANRLRSERFGVLLFFLPGVFLFFPPLSPLLRRDFVFFLRRTNDSTRAREKTR